MQTPYDWQEAIGHRAQFILNRLSHGSPVIAASIEPGIVFFAYRRTAGKLFEIYDRLGMGGLGQQSDIEAIRMSALDFAHQEGFSRSESDVTIKRVVTSVSTPIKQSFADFSAAPVIARSLFAEVGDTPTQDQYVMLDFDGDFHTRRNYGFIAPTEEAAIRLDERLSKAFLTSADVDTAVEELESIWRDGLEPDPSQTMEHRLQDMKKEIAILERAENREVRFHYLTEADE